MRFAIFFLFLISNPLNTYALENEEIVSLLKKWQEAFNSKNIETVCQTFDKELVASYPGVQDRNYEQMCQTLSRALTNPDKSYRYAPPKIEQILVNGDLAVVRLIWVMEVADVNGQVVERIEEKGLDVLRRESNGWKILISYAYPL